MTRFLRLGPAVLALVLLPLTASPAHAANSSFHGDCGFNTIAQETLTGNQDRFVGVVYAEALLYSSTYGTVVNGTVTCELRLNGVPQPSAPHWGSGVVAFAEPLTYVATDTDTVQLCITVDYTSDDTPTETRCQGATTLQMPPQAWIDLINWVLDMVTLAEVGYVDPAICPLFATLEPGAPPVTVNQEGDVFYEGEIFWDCPPYQYLPPPDPDPEPPIPGLFKPSEPTGGGYNTGTAGLLALDAPVTRDVASACAFVTEPATGTITVVGSTVTLGASTARIRCRLEDTATGAVLYDDTVTAGAPGAYLHGTASANGVPVTVCTEGAGIFADRSVTVGLACRPGEPLDRLVP